MVKATKPSSRKSEPVSTPAKSPKTAKSAPSPDATSTSASKGKKRVRVVEEDEGQQQVATPEVKKSTKKGSNLVEKKDLREKDLDEIEKISSKDAPNPKKGAMKKGKEAVVAQAEEDGEDGEEEEEEAGSDDEEEIDFLAGFESGSEGEDSSDDEMANGEEDKEEFAVEKLPKVKSKGKDEQSEVQKKLEAKAERKRNAKTGTIYLGRIPHGFHEEQMRSYFSQFGEISRLRLSRNKTTGASKHYAFIEFAYASVAQIVQETMDNYLLSGHILVCKVVPDDEIHPKLWIGANRTFRPVPKGRRDAVKRAAPKTDAQKDSIKKRLVKREEAKRQQLAALGIEYDFSGYASKPAVEEKKKAAPAKAAAKGKKEKKADEPAKKKARKST